MDFKKIKKTAKRRGFTLKEMLEKAEISETNFYNWQRKLSIETKYLEIIAKVLHVPVGYFFDEECVNGNGNVNNNGGVVANGNGKITIKLERQENEIEKLNIQIEGLEGLLEEKERYIKLLEKNLEIK